MNGRGAGTERDGEAGFALISVLLGMLIVISIAASFALVMRSGSTIAINHVENARAAALADAGIARAVLALLHPDRAARWRADGREYAIDLRGHPVSIRIFDEYAKIDLNEAPAALLSAAFRWAGANDGAARSLAAAVADYRDRDASRGPRGAEDREYRAAGLSHGAKDSPFEDLGELRRVLNMPQFIYDGVAPVMTIHGRHRGVNLLNATPDTLAAMGGGETGEADRERLARNPALARLGGFIGEAFAPVVTIRAEAKTPNGGSFVRETVVRFTGDKDAPIRILRWRRSW